MAVDARFEISVKVYPTEDPEVVASGLRSIFSDIELMLSEGSITGESKDIDSFIEILAKLHIRDSARDIILGRKNEDISVFHLNKQAATNGKVSFTDPFESSLGAIEVRFSIDDWDWLEKELSPPILKNPKWDEE